MKQEKILYFEGAGCVPKNDVENCRIRTAFTNDKGERLYLEITSNLDGSYGCIDFCHYADEKIDAQGYPITEHHEQAGKRIQYTKDSILKFVNEKLDCSFDKIVILNHFAGYYVHKDGGGYNMGDEFPYDEERTKQTEKISDYFYKYEKEILGKRYPNFSIYWKDNKLNVLIHYNCYNHYITIDDVFKFDFNYQKPDSETLRKARLSHGVYSNKEVA